MEKQIVSFKPILFIVVIIFSIIQVIMLNRYSTVGEKLNQFDFEIRKIEGENTKLSEKIASASSIAALSQKAANIGLIKTLDIASLETPLPVAYNLRLSP